MYSTVGPRLSKPWKSGCTDYPDGNPMGFNWCTPYICTIHKYVVASSSLWEIRECVFLALPYCPVQELMVACSSSPKNWEWVVTWRRCLNGPTIPVQAPTRDSKLADSRYWIDLRCSFTRFFFFSQRRLARQYGKQCPARKRTNLKAHSLSSHRL